MHEVAPAGLEDIASLREEYRREMGCQIVHDSWHRRGFASSWLLRSDGAIVGYGSVGAPPREPRDILKELFIRPGFRAHVKPLVRALVTASGARRIEAQTNDRLLLLVLLDAAVDLTSDTILFDDALTTSLAVPGVTVRRLTDDDRGRVFEHTREPVGDWGLELDGTIVATGGLAFHYNPPFGDIYMEVEPNHRRRGLGSYLVQELKRVCAAMGSVPAARCGDTNVGSRRALERAGMLPCARIVRGRIDPARL